jgi:hypothetical protein
MNTLIEKPANTADSLPKQAAWATLPSQGALLQPVLPRPVLNDAIQVDEVQTLADAMTAICDDCCKNSLQYVLRSDTGHDGE